MHHLALDILEVMLIQELKPVFKLPVQNSAKNIVKLYILKGQCHIIFDILLFHESNPPRPLISSVKWFCK